MTDYTDDQWQMRTIVPNESYSSLDIEKTILQSDTSTPTKTHTGSKISDLRNALTTCLTTELSKRYEIKCSLGKGAGGQVFEVNDQILKRDIALKFLSISSASGKRHKDDFLREARIVGELQHPGILPVHDLYYDSSGDMFFTMRKADGVSLGAAVNKAKDNAAHKFVERTSDKIEIILRLCEIVAYAHSRGVIHRDIKPDNIMLGDYGEVILIDWGIAAHIDNPPEEGVTGTPLFMPPEQSRGEACDERSDIYAICTTLYFLLNSETVKQTTLSRDFLEMKKQGRVSIMTNTNPSVIPAPLLAIIERGLQNNPADRYQTVQDLMTDLKNYLEGLRVSVYSESLSETVRRLLRTHRKRILIATVIALALGSTGALFVHNEKKKTRNAALSQFNTGITALGNSYKQNNPELKEEFLIEAEAALSRASTLLPSYTETAKHLQESYMEHFRLATENRNWRQAREKLMQARNAGLPEKDYKNHLASLLSAAQAREKDIRERIEQIMTDTEKGVKRSILHANAVAELISMKDPITVSELSRYLTQGTKEQQLMCLKALGWVGNSSVVPLILPWIKNKDIDGKPINYLYRSAAAESLMRLAPFDANVFKEIESEISDSSSDYKNDNFTPAIRDKYTIYSRRFLSTKFEDLEKRSNIPLEELQQYSFSFHIANMFKEALYCAEQLITIAPDDYKSFLARSRIYMAMGELQKAMIDAKNAESMTDENAEIHQTLSNLFLELNDLNKGVIHCIKAIEIDPTAKRYISLAFLYSHLDMHKEALYCCNKAIELKPDMLTAYTARGCTYRQLGQLDNAIANFDFAININPTQTAYINRGIVYYLKKDFSSALSDIDQAIFLDPRYGKAYEARAAVKIATGNKEGAVTDYLTAAKLHNNPKKKHEMELLAGDLIAEINPNEKADPDNPETIARNAFEAYRREDFETATDAFFKAFQLSESPVFFQHYGGYMYASISQTRSSGDATPLLRRWLKYDSNSISAKIYLALSLVDKGDTTNDELKEALSLAKRAEKQLPSRNPANYCQIGWIYYKNNDFDKAISLHEKGIKECQLRSLPVADWHKQMIYIKAMKDQQKTP